MITSKVFEDLLKREPSHTNLLDFTNETTFYYATASYYMTTHMWKTTMIRVKADTFPIEPKVMGTLDCNLENGKLSPCGQYLYSLSTEGLEDHEEFVLRKIRLDTLELTTYDFAEKLPMDAYRIPPVRFYFTSSYKLMLIDLNPDEPYPEGYGKISIERTRVYKFEFDENNLLVHLTRLQIPDLPYKFEGLHEHEHTFHWTFDVVGDPLFLFNEHIDGSVYTLDYENDTKWVKNTVEGPETDPWNIGCSIKIYHGNGIMAIQGYNFHNSDNCGTTKCYELIFDRVNHRCRRVVLFTSNQYDMIVNQTKTLFVMNQAVGRKSQLFSFFEILDLRPSLRHLSFHVINDLLQKRMNSRQRRRLSCADLNSHVKRYVCYEEANILLRQLLPQVKSQC
ncbi:hypothetical protein M3Y95_00513800 [Aphelenchoides besseyi]|nr:hypothetical protein M3Y95_00513800 [Aphelenchoides besseyi]